MELSSPVRRFIERQRVARLATVDAAGFPHVVPICFALLGEALYSIVDEKPKRTADLQRLKNIEANPNVTVLFDEYDEDWTRLGWVMLRGRACVSGDDGDYWRALGALTARYPQYRHIALAGNPMVRIECEAVRYWGRLDAEEQQPERAAVAIIDAMGLHLVRTVERIAAAHVTTEHRAGLSSGAVSRLRLSGADAREEPVESEDEAAMPDEGGRMLRYSLAALDDGIYVAESVGPANTLRQTYFEVFEARVTRVFDDRRRAVRELRRQGD